MYYTFNSLGELYLHVSELYTRMHTQVRQLCSEISESIINYQNEDLCCY